MTTIPVSWAHKSTPPIYEAFVTCFACYDNESINDWCSSQSTNIQGSLGTVPLKKILDVACINENLHKNPVETGVDSALHRSDTNFESEIWRDIGHPISFDWVMKKK